MGTAVGSLLFTKYGWRPSAAVSLAWAGFMLFAIFLRGPNIPRHRWLGYAGGIRPRRNEDSGPSAGGEGRSIDNIPEAESQTEAPSRVSIDNAPRGTETRKPEQEKGDYETGEKGLAPHADVAAAA